MGKYIWLRRVQLSDDYIVDLPHLSRLLDDLACWDFVKVELTMNQRRRPRETVTFLAQKAFSNLPGKEVITLIITLPPRGATPPHRHGGAAVTSCMIKGTILNQMNSDEPFEVSGGESFFETPDCHHMRAENNTDEEASFFAILVIDGKKLKERPGSLLELDVDMEEKERKGEVECE